MKDPDSMDFYEVNEFLLNKIVEGVAEYASKDLVRLSALSLHRLDEIYDEVKEAAEVVMDLIGELTGHAIKTAG